MKSREENESSYDPRLFVDADVVDQLKNPNWQIIYGRRGAGKTCLLLEYHRRQQTLKNEMTIYQSLEALTPSADEGVLSTRGLAQEAFEEFVRSLAENLSNVVLSQIDQLGDSSQERERRLDDAISLIDVLYDSASSRGYRPNADGPVTVELSNRGSVEEGRNRQANLGFNRLGASASRESSSGRSSEERLTNRADHLRRFSPIKRAMSQVLEYLGLERLDILIDEWSVLEVEGDPEPQVHFAEYLKRSFFGIPGVSVKVGAIRSRSRFGRPNEGGVGFRGLELGDDIFEGVDLDSFRLSRQQLLNFYAMLIVRRLMHAHEGLGDSTVKLGDSDWAKSFCDRIFANRNGLQELAISVEGIPREFITMFNSVSRDFGYRVPPDRWDVGTIRNKIIEHSADRLKELRSSSRAWALMENIERVTARQGTRYFLVRKEDRAIKPVIDKLFDAHLIHDIAQEKLHPRLRAEYVPYMLSYGVYLNMNPRRNGTASDYDHRQDQTVIPIDEPLEYTVELSDSDLVSFCDDCNRPFDRSHPVFLRHGCCPRCGTLQENAALPH